MNLDWVRRFWDFIDDRDIDKHAVALSVIGLFLYGTGRITLWGMYHADTWMEAAKSGHNIAGSEAAIVIAAVLGPWGLMVSTIVPLVVSFYFKSRTDT